MTLLLVLPLVIPLFTAVVCVACWGRRGVQRVASVAGAGALLASAVALLNAVDRGGVLAMQVGGWPAPFGVTLVADLLSAVMVVVTGAMGLAGAVYSLGGIDARRETTGYHVLFHALLAGVSGAFLTGDVFNLFVWYEVMLMASFVLMALGGERAQLEGAIKYVTLNLIASTLFLTAVGILYAVAGTLNMADLAVRFNGATTATASGVRLAVAMLFLVAFGIKAAVFPLFGWLPASYHTPPVAVTVILSALLTKVGVYSLLRLFTLVFAAQVEVVRPLLLVLAGLTMVTGVLGAVAQYDVRRLLSFHIVSQIGYLLMGLALGTPLAVAAAVFFMVHVIFAKSALFMVSGAAHRVLGVYDLRASGGLYRTQPLLAALFLLPALALAGFPPLSGFYAKLGLVRAGLEAGSYGLVATALGVSVLTTFSMMKIWAEAYWKPQPAPEGVSMNVCTPFDGLRVSGHTPAAPERGPLVLSSSKHERGDNRHSPEAGWLAVLAATTAVVAVTVVLGVAAEPGFALAVRAADQLLHPEAYLRAVLCGGSAPCSW